MKPILGEGLVSRRVTVAVEDVVLVRALLEAEEGLGILFAERGGDLVIASTSSQEGELCRFLASAARTIPSLVVSGD